MYGRHSMLSSAIGSHSTRTGYGSSTAARMRAFSVRCADASSASPHSTASTLPNTSPSSPTNVERCAERMEEPVGIAPRLGGLGQAVERLDEAPQRVRVEDEPGARHDVGPVARLVLLQQEKALVFLAGEPPDRGLDMSREHSSQRSR